MTGVDPILSLRSVSVLLGGRRGWFRRTVPPVRAVNDIDLDIFPGEILGLAGESGCGKTTLGRTILGLQRESAGTIALNGATVSGLPSEKARRARRNVQYVHQDAAAALDPWWSIGRTLREGLTIHGIADAGDRVASMLTAVGLEPSAATRYPHEFSGGQLRRIALARMLLLSPKLLILDEPTSGLDMSVQATILNLLLDLRQRLGLTYLFVSHDLSVVERLSDRVAIMYLGRIVEIAPARTLFARPLHPYTRSLLAAAPRLHRGNRIPLTGDPPRPTDIHAGCAFHGRCPVAIARCATVPPPPRLAGERHLVACHLSGGEASSGAAAHQGLDTLAERVHADEEIVER